MITRSHEIQTNAARTANWAAGYHLHPIDARIPSFVSDPRPSDAKPVDPTEWVQSIGAKKVTAALKMQTQAEVLAGRILAAKKRESDARAERVKAETDLAAIYADELRTEGQRHIQVGPFTVTIKTAINRKTTREALEAISDRVPEAFRKRLIVWKPQIDLKELRFIQSNEPELAEVVSEAITETPAKVSVAVAVAVEA